MITLAVLQKMAGELRKVTRSIAAEPRPRVGRGPQISVIATTWPGDVELLRLTRKEAEDLRDSLDRLLTPPVDASEFMSRQRLIAGQHQSGDAACGREWTCQCGTCRIVRAYEHKIKP